MDDTLFAQRHATAILACVLIAMPVAGALSWRALTRWLDRRDLRAQRIGIGVGAFVVASAGVALFVAMARRLVQGESFAAADQRLLDAIRHGVPAPLARAFAQLTHLGDPWFLTLLCASCCALLIFSRRFGLAIYLAAVTSAGGLINHALKVSMRRARPADALVPLPESFSFPSGHTFGSMVCYGMCAYALMRFAPRRRDASIVAAACLLIVLIGMSRVVIGVHFPGDVIGGLAAGGAWLAACVAAAEIARRR